MWTVMEVLAYNGERGIAYDHVTETSYHFKSGDVVEEDLGALKSGCSVLVGGNGVIECADRSFVRMYCETD